MIPQRVIDVSEPAKHAYHKYHTYVCANCLQACYLASPQGQRINKQGRVYEPDEQYVPPMPVISAGGSLALRTCLAGFKVITLDAHILVAQKTTFMLNVKTFKT